MLKPLITSDTFVYQPHIRTFFWADHQFYLRHKEELIAWADFYNCKMPSDLYGWVTCPDDDTAMAFKLRWGGQI